MRRLLRILAGSSSVAALEVEKAVLRHQLAVLGRAVKRPLLRRRDRVLLAAPARRVIGNYIDHRYPNRPHSRLGYRTPLEVGQTWEGGRALVKTAA